MVDVHSIVTATFIRTHPDTHWTRIRRASVFTRHRGAGHRDLWMPRSFYKGERLGNLPACAICMGRGHGPRALLHLPLGVSVWLCAAHRDPEWLAARAGRDLVVSLQTVWRAADCLTARRSRALTLFQAALRASYRTRDLPGSYSWRALRREAEARFAAGEAPSAVIDELRRRELDRPGPAHPRRCRRCAGGSATDGGAGGPVRTRAPAQKRPGCPTSAGGREPQVPVRPRGGDAPPRGPLQQPLLEEVRLVDVLDRVGRLPHAVGEGPEAHRPALEGLGEPAEDLAVELLQAERVHLQQLQRLLGDGAVHAGDAPHLGDVADPAQQAVGDPRRPPRALGQDGGAVVVDVDVEQAGGPADDRRELGRRRSSSAGGGPRTARAAAW